jgi:hypothetical protein
MHSLGKTGMLQQMQEHASKRPREVLGLKITLSDGRREQFQECTQEVLKF